MFSVSAEKVIKRGSSKRLIFAGNIKDVDALFIAVHYICDNPLKSKKHAIKVDKMGPNMKTDRTKSFNK